MNLCLCGTVTLACLVLLRQPSRPASNLAYALNTYSSPVVHDITLRDVLFNVRSCIECAGLAVMASESWIDRSVPEGSDFPIYNLPWGVFRAPCGDQHICVAIGDSVLDVHEWARGLQGSTRDLPDGAASALQQVRCLHHMPRPRALSLAPPIQCRNDNNIHACVLTSCSQCADRGSCTLGQTL